MAERDFEAEAEDLIQDQLLNHEDPAVRAIAALAPPPREAIKRVAEKLRSKAGLAK